MAGKKQIDQAWEKAKEISGKNPDAWRKDIGGNTIRKASYGTQGQYGWELDHKYPQSRGGSDNQRNIQALYWQDNRKKSDTYPYKNKK